MNEGNLALISVFAIIFLPVLLGIIVYIWNLIEEKQRIEEKIKEKTNGNKRKNKSKNSKKRN